MTGPVKAKINSIGSFVGRQVLLQGWLCNFRSSGKIKFLQIRDGTGLIQAVAVRNDLGDAEFEKLSDLTTESSIEVTGAVSKDARAPGGYELHVSGCRILHVAEEYPITPKEHGEDFLLAHRHLWLRSPRQHAIMKVRNEVIRASRDFFDGRGFLNIDAPIFTPNACEETSTLFETDYFGRTAFLTQSGQLYMEAAAMAYGRVYCFGPTFRAENSKTRRHLTEFWMIEPEVAFIDFDGVIDLAEEYVAYLVERTLENCDDALDRLERDKAPLEAVKLPFVRKSYTDVVEELRAAGSGIEWGADLGAKDETIITKKYDKPLSVHRYPRNVKAFYMQPDPDNADLALGVDILAPEGYGEILGGGQRMDDHDTLRDAILAQELPEEAFDWYLDLRKYGTVPHGGFGLGVERTIAWLCGIHHVREAIPFPRTITRLKP